MKVLWITNLLFPEAKALISEESQLKSTGGWMTSLANEITKLPDIKLSIATVSNTVKSLNISKGKKITYYTIPYGKGNTKYNKEYEAYWKEINKIINPDIIHIHGTEFTHGLAYINACGNEKVVISIQGLKSGIAPFYLADLNWKDIYGNLTFHDIIKGNLYHGQRTFSKTGELEKEAIRKVKHIIGRTSWDRAHTWAINPNAKYHVCNEILREEFYDGSTWSYEKCTPYTIFLSQGYYPLKGLHQLLKAMPLILKQYPETRIRVAGGDITQNKGISGLIHFTGYGKIVKRLIKKFNLNNKIAFIGPLNAEEMKAEYLNANIFVCPSSIENSPNSLAEAQILGVPCVASYVGGIADMMQGCEENLYRFEEQEMLAEKVCTIFANKEEQCNMIRTAKQRHDRNKICETLYNIYKSII